MWSPAARVSTERGYGEKVRMVFLARMVKTYPLLVRKVTLTGFSEPLCSASMSATMPPLLVRRVRVSLVVKFPAILPLEVWNSATSARTDCRPVRQCPYYERKLLTLE